jgi:hypothetical protein
MGSKRSAPMDPTNDGPPWVAYRHTMSIVRSLARWTLEAMHGVVFTIIVAMERGERGAAHRGQAAQRSQQRDVRALDAALVAREH